MKKFFPAVLMLVFVISVMATATYAWFSMNTSGQVTGMAMYATVKDNLMIAPDTLSNTENISDYYFTPEITQVVGATLEPVSSVDGVNFYYTKLNNVSGDGDAIDDVYIKYMEDDSFNPSLYANAKANALNARNTATPSDYYNFDREFNENNNIVLDDLAPAADRNSVEIVYGYVDYVFRLKATNTVNVPRAIQFTKFDLTYLAPKDYSTAFRAAIFVEDISSGIVSPGVSTERLKAIYSFEGAHNYTDGKAVRSVSDLGDTVCSLNETPTIGYAAPTSATFLKVVIRLWLEGEDMTCTADTFKKLTQDWKLDLELSFEGDYVITTQNIKKYTSTVFSSTTYTYDGKYVYNASTDTRLTADETPNEVKSAFYQSITVPKTSELDVPKTFFFNDGFIYNADFTVVDPTDGSDAKANKAKALYFRSTDYSDHTYYYNRGVIFDEDWNDVTDSAPADVKKTFFDSATYATDTYYCNSHDGGNYEIFDEDLNAVPSPADRLKTEFYRKQTVGSVDYYCNGTKVFRWIESTSTLEEITSESVVLKMKHLLESIFDVEIV